MKNKNRRVLEVSATIMAMIVIVASLLLLNNLLSHNGSNIGKTPAVSDNNTTDSNTTEIGGTPGTGLASYAAAIKDPQVLDWTKGKQNVSAVSISTDLSAGGSAQDWKVVLSSDEGQTTFYVENGGVVNMVPIRNDYGTEPAIDTGKVIDSDRAWSIAAAEVPAGTDLTSPSPMTLKSIGNNTYWDVYFISETQRQIVRIDALTGNVIQKVSSGGD